MNVLKIELKRKEEEAEIRNHEMAILTTKFKEAMQESENLRDELRSKYFHNLPVWILLLM